MLLKLEFPDVETVEFEGYDISYPEGSGMAWKMFRSIPRILKRIEQEHAELDRLIDTLRLDAVISDNRFGLYTDRIPCVYMTHQVMIKAPFFESLLHRMHLAYMQRFTQVWVPDSIENGLSGDLGHKYALPENGKFVGPLSRFRPLQVENTSDILVIISGPEPQRTRFEKLVLKQLQGFEGKVVAVLGTPDQEIDRIEGNVRVVSHLNALQLQRELAAARLVVSRSGYSTIMDLSALGKQAVFVPTPGQTEQEYLAKKFNEEGKHMMMKQSDFGLKRAWDLRSEFTGFSATEVETYKAAVDQLISLLS
jgi:uncharacterized protein (TIGR00661 family)